MEEEHQNMKKKHTRILLVDDEPDILEILDYNLTSEGYQVEKAKNGLEALEKVEDWKPHLVLLDVMMPEMDGIETCELLRKKSNLPNLAIVFLTARSEDYSQVAGLEAGADDYITKPIKPKVLVSKIKAILRRFSSANPKNEIVEAGDLIINREEYKIIYKGETLVLPRKEFELLFLLASRPHKVFEREEILNRVWGNEVVVGGRTIDVHIRKLREKIGDKHFKTVKGVGYKYVV
ncbi:MAG: Alkaline phosphatase synthesis transcriptional regulatory protein PhoP [Bacteroidota bacterium]|nr:MAG: Alkaline phosphatase synthesis transcriptional regulatory protein PhoP [Bacteroidota bacterium]